MMVVAGAPADLLAVAGGSLREVLAERSEQRIVIGSERLLSRTTVRREDAIPIPYPLNSTTLVERSKEQSHHEAFRFSSGLDLS
jgi:hypothetical protein